MQIKYEKVYFWREHLNYWNDIFLLILKHNAFDTISFIFIHDFFDYRMVTIMVTMKVTVEAAEVVVAVEAVHVEVSEVAEDSVAASVVAATSVVAPVVVVASVAVPPVADLAVVASAAAVAVKAALNCAANYGASLITSSAC